MRKVIGVLGVVALAGSATARDVGERLVSPDGLMASSVAGVPARLRIDPAAPGIPILSPEIARAARLKAGPFGASFRIGSITVPARTAAIRLGLGAGPVKRRVSWGERRFVADADGSVGPAGLPDRVIRFQLREPRPGERTATLPMVGGGGVFGGWDFIGAEIAVDGAPMRVRFDPRRPSLATAGAGVALARSLGGAVEGPVRGQEIAFGVERPVRTLRLARPLGIGPVALDRLLVRVSDWGDASSIQEAGAAADPDEVVVVAKGKRDRSRDVLTVGHDALARCSSITFDKPRRQVRLSCA